MASGRSAVIVCCAVAGMSACAHPSAPVKSSTAPASSSDSESLIVSVDVRRIAHFDNLTPQSHADMRQPSQGNVNAPGPCRAVGNSDLTFATCWTQFRGIAYRGTTDDLEPGEVAPIDEVNQAIAVYPDAGAAHGALD